MKAAKHQLHPFQDAGASWVASRRHAYLADEMGLGKAQPLSARVLTPAGWSRMGEMRIGSEVIGSDGLPHRVLGVFPQGERDVYEVCFSDGTLARCDAEHLWAVQTLVRRQRGHPWQALSVSAMLEAGVRYRNGVSKYRIPVMAAAAFAPVKLPIHPYVFGVLLGDGSLTGGALAFSVPPGKTEILDRVREIVGAERVGKPHGNPQSPQYSITGLAHKSNDVLDSVRALGLAVRSVARFIPGLYMFGTPADRLELLRGLMDTDGSAAKGRTTFHTCGLILAEDVADLVRSLGGVAIVREYTRPNKPVEWHVNVRLDVCPFHLSRKAKGWRPPSRVHGKYITEIRKAGRELQQCIAVSAPDHLYVTDGYNVTHNTPQLAVAAERAGAKRALIVAPAIMEDDWCDTLEDFTPNRPPAHRLRDPEKIPATGDVVTSYERATMHRDALMRCTWDVLICDEAKNLKNQDAERSRAILNPIYGGRRSLASVSGAVWLADGTPIPNNPAELFSALRTAGLFQGRYWDFAYRFCEVKEITIAGHKQRKIVGARNVEELRQMLRGYMLRRTTAEVLPELPPLHIGEISLPGAEIDASNPILPVLRQLDADAHDAIDASISTGDWTMRHVPHISTIRRLTGLAKAHATAEVARLELECVGDKIVLFGWHSDVLTYLQHQLRDYNPVMLTGAETHAKRRKAIRAFQNDPGTRVAIGQTRAAGAGITLTASCRLIVAEAAWTPADNEQVEKRVHRIGQHRETSVDYLTLQGSSDERVTAAVRQKRHAAKQILTSELT